MDFVKFWFSFWERFIKYAPGKRGELEEKAYVELNIIREKYRANDDSLKAWQKKFIEFNDSWIVQSLLPAVSVFGTKFLMDYINQPLPDRTEDYNEQD